MTENDKIEIRVELKGQVKHRFLEIQKHIGITNKTDVIRFLISSWPFGEQPKGEETQEGVVDEPEVLSDEEYVAVVKKFAEELRRRQKEEGRT